MFIPLVYGDSLPSGTNVSSGPYPRGGEIHVVVLADPGLSISFPDPSGPLYRLFSTVTGGVYGAVLHFDSGGVSYSIDVSPNSNTLMSFSHPIAVTNVRVTIQSRGYSDDAVHVGYFYSSLPPTDYLPSGTSVGAGPEPSDTHVVVLVNPGPQTISFPNPNGPVSKLFSTVTTYVQDAVLYFENDGTTFAKK